MINRKVDDKGRIYLDAELADVFLNNSVYLRYNLEKNEVSVMNIDGVLELAAEVERTYGKSLMSNPPAWKAMRELGASTHYSKIQRGSKLIIPTQIREIAGIKRGDVLEAKVLDDKCIVLKKID